MGKAEGGEAQSIEESRCRGIGTWVLGGGRRREMSDVLRQAVARVWREQRDYGVRLVSDLDDSQWRAQPIAGRKMNHAEWVIGHLTAYCEALWRMGEGIEATDPGVGEFGKGSVPRGIGEGAGAVDGGAMVRRFVAAHDRLGDVFARLDEKALAREAPLERWRVRWPTLGEALVALMMKHEAGHLGQLSAWRRAMGLAAV